MKSVTIYEVAKEAKVSLATVSRVINGSHLVKEKTRLAVENAIVKLGYKPNAMAQGLVLKKTTTIALIVPESSFSYLSQLILGICAVSKIYNYNVHLYTISEGISSIREIVDSVIKTRADGVVFINNNYLDPKEIIDGLSEFSVPLVLVGSKINDKNVCSVYIDYESAVKEICDKYLDKGIKEIMLLEDRRNVSITNQMIEGAKKSFEEHKIKFDNYLEYSNDERSSFKFLRSYFKFKKDCKLMIVSRDSQALACLNAARENNIEVPDDLEIICLNESKYTSMVRPKISGLDVPSYDLGSVAMRVIQKMLNNEEVDDKQKVLTYFYRERETTKNKE